MYLIGTAYNFCTPHASLRRATAGATRRACTPAMAVDMTDHCWSVQDALLAAAQAARTPLASTSTDN